MPKKWLLKHSPTGNPDLSESLEISPTIMRLLAHRGFNDSKAIHRFLNPRLENLTQPSLYADMEPSVARIRQAIAKKETIIVYGDYDVDGLTASSVMNAVLRKLGAEVRVVIPERMKEGYGLNIERLKREVTPKVSLVITVDTGITAHTQIRWLREHQPRAGLYPAEAHPRGEYFRK